MSSAAFQFIDKNVGDSKAFFFADKEVIVVRLVDAPPSRGSLTSDDGMLSLNLDDEGLFRGFEILQFDLTVRDRDSDNTPTAIPGTIRWSNLEQTFTKPLLSSLWLDPLFCEVVFSEEEATDAIQIGSSLKVTLGARGQLVRVLISSFSDPAEFRALCSAKRTP